LALLQGRGKERKKERKKERNQGLVISNELTLFKRALKM
jgi:hypothetical protein